MVFVLQYSPVLARDGPTLNLGPLIINFQYKKKMAVSDENSSFWDRSGEYLFVQNFFEL